MRRTNRGTFKRVNVFAGTRAQLQQQLKKYKGFVASNTGTPIAPIGYNSYMAYAPNGSIDADGNPDWSNFKRFPG